jgi:D-alanyl-D-alanine carboxypeptidase
MIGALALCLSLALPLPTLQPLGLPPPPTGSIPLAEPPEIEALAWSLYAVEEETELWSGNGGQQRAMASVTKVMTALLVAELADLMAAVEISATAVGTPIGYAEQPRVLQGDRWTVEELLDNMLIQSGNDAAVALAEHVAGSTEAFVAIMNDRAAQLGLEDTRFANPNGLDAEDHFSTARDLIRLGAAAIENPIVARTMRISALTFDPGTRDPIPIRNTNRLLGTFPGVLGIKTGDTLAAGQVLLSYLDTGHGHMLAAVMGSADHMAATAELLAYALRTLGPRDYLLAPAAGTPLAEFLPDWLVARLEAVGPLNDGQWAPDRLPTPRREAVIDAFRELLPPVLGGAD